MHPLTLSHEKARVYLKAKSGTVISTRISISRHDHDAQIEADRIDRELKDRNIHDIRDFWPILEKGYKEYRKPWGMMRHTAIWLNTMLGKPGATWHKQWGHSNYLR